VEIVKTWKEKGVEEVEVVWVNDSLVIYPVYPRKS
jgi:peroxiredoxin